MNNSLKKEIARPLSNTDILKLINNNAKIVLYEDLYHCNNIDELLKPYNACFILYQ